MRKREKAWQQRLLLAAAAIAACCQLFHAHYHEACDRGLAPAVREMRADAVASFRFAADAAGIVAHDDFCPICAGAFTSDAPPADPPTPILLPPAAAAHFSADAAPIRFFPLPPGRAPPAPRA